MRIVVLLATLTAGRALLARHGGISMHAPQNSGGARQRHKMMGRKASMRRIDKQRELANDAKYAKSAMPAKPPPQAIGSGGKVLSTKAVGKDEALDDGSPILKLSCQLVAHSGLALGPGVTYEHAELLVDCDAG